MTRLLAEQPLVVAVMLAVLASASLYGWLQTGQRAAGIAGVVLLALIPLAWVLSENWVTDRERIEKIIYETADAVEANAPQAAVRVVADPDVRARARALLERFEFTRADVNRIRRIEMIDGAAPPQAEVELTVKVTVDEKRGAIQDVTAPRRVTLHFRQQRDGRWRVTEFRQGPLVGTDPYSTLSSSP